jgi:hypothetical protein
MVVETKERMKHGLKNIKQIKRLSGAKKPIADLFSGEIFLRESKLMDMVKRVQSLEDKFSHEYGVYEVLEVHTTGEIFRSYFECHMTADFEAGVTLRGVKGNAISMGR